MREHTISISKDFGEAPAGRYHPKDGDFTGELFRKTLLVPSLRTYDRTIVLLDNESGYGSSFLEEAFGGLVREEKFTLQFLEKHLLITAPESNMIYVNDAIADIKEAAKNE